MQKRWFVRAPQDSTIVEEFRSELKVDAVVAELLLQLDCEKYLQLSELASGCVILRYLGDSAEQARLLFTRCWQLLRPLSIAREACLPRIWST